MNLEKLVSELVKIPNETPWIEFKYNNYDPQVIGKNISALANGAALHEKANAYMLWGINDATHEIIGTEYDLQSMKKGNEELENWLRSLLSPNAEFEFSLIHIGEKNVGVLRIGKANAQPVTFEKNTYIKIGSYTKDLKDYPATQAQLWDKLRNMRFEEQLTLQDLELECVSKV